LTRVVSWSAILSRKITQRPQSTTRSPPPIPEAEAEDAADADAWREEGNKKLNQHAGVTDRRTFATDPGRRRRRRRGESPTLSRGRAAGAPTNPSEEEEEEEEEEEDEAAEQEAATEAAMSAGKGVRVGGGEGEGGGTVERSGCGEEGWGPWRGREAAVEEGEEGCA
jgi:hypothetical protein